MEQTDIVIFFNTIYAFVYIYEYIWTSMCTFTIFFVIQHEYFLPEHPYYFY